MSALASPDQRPCADQLAALRAQLTQAERLRGPVLAFGVTSLDEPLAGHGLDSCGLHEFAAASAALSDDAATTLFAAGIAARFAGAPGSTVLWALSKFDLYAPGLEQVGLGPDKVLYAQGRKDSEVLALAEDGLRDGALACVLAEVKAADQTATRRLQLAATDGGTPMLLYRRHRARDRCPFDQPSSAMTRWRIGCAPSARLPYPGVGRARWSVELVRQRIGHPFSLEVEACDDQGRLALPASSRDRADTPERARGQAGAVHRAA
ncbi:ImuA family protein [Sphingomonas fennica]|uniref:Protein ImuA n=1 Tax=Edaphosphingomonas fennica TaxID=114404 RepID=A0A2T4HS52_9SPHN|nr:protein ImuA [Sphingomonas fennica]PTD18649.1 protein ImuA [Sphingomonas fennica]